MHQALEARIWILLIFQFLQGLAQYQAQSRPTSCVLKLGLPCITSALLCRFEGHQLYLCMNEQMQMNESRDSAVFKFDSISSTSWEGNGFVQNPQKPIWEVNSPSGVFAFYVQLPVLLHAPFMADYSDWGPMNLEGV